MHDARRTLGFFSLFGVYPRARAHLQVCPSPQHTPPPPHPLSPTALTRTHTRAKTVQVRRFVDMVVFVAPPPRPHPPSPSCMMQAHSVWDFFSLFGVYPRARAHLQICPSPQHTPPLPPPLPHSPHAHAHARENRTGASFCRYGGVCRTPAPPSPPSPSCMMQGALLDFFHFLAFIQEPVPIYKLLCPSPQHTPPSPPPLPHSPHAHAHARENRTGASFCRYGGVCRTPAPPSPPSPSSMMQGALLDFFTFWRLSKSPCPFTNLPFTPSTPPPSPPPLPHSPHAHAHAHELKPVQRRFVDMVVFVAPPPRPHPRRLHA